VAFRFPNAIGAVVFTCERPGLEPAAEWVQGGEPSTAFALNRAAGPPVVAASELVAANSRPITRGGEAEFPSARFAGMRSRGSVGVLLVLGLLLLVRVGEVLVQRGRGRTIAGTASTARR
jgi:hypothetical protein